MPSLRRSGGTNSPAGASLTSRPPITMLPVSLRSSPATMRRVVVLPQPDGPSSVTNSPCSIARSMLSTAFTSAKCRPTECRVTLGTRVSRYLKICLASSSMASCRSGTVVPNALVASSGRISSRVFSTTPLTTGL